MLKSYATSNSPPPAPALERRFFTPQPSGSGSAIAVALGEPTAPIPLDLLAESVRFEVPVFLAPGASAHRLVVYDEAGVFFQSVPLQANANVTVAINAYTTYVVVWRSERLVDNRFQTNVSSPRIFGFNVGAPPTCYIPPRPEIELLVDNPDDPNPEVDLRIYAPPVIPGGWKIDLLLLRDTQPLPQTLATDVREGNQLLLSDLGISIRNGETLRLSWKPIQTI